MAEKNFFKHWPTMLLGLIVAAILLVAVFSFQLPKTQVAVVTTFGEPSLVAEPGLHFRWPYPFQQVTTFDTRLRCFSGSEGKLEETMTKDGHNILVGIYVTYRISDAKLFFIKLENVTKAENLLNSLMRGAKNSAFGNYEFNEIVNTDPKKMKLKQIENDILGTLRERTTDYGLQIESVGINTINVPKTISEKVFDRMIAERKKESDRIIAEGEMKAKDIRTNADTERAQILAEAQADAKVIRGHAEAEAARYYKTFSKKPELAAFLRKLEALRSILKEGRTTLVVDPSTAPFDLLKAGALDWAPDKPIEEPAPKKPAPKN